MNRTTTHLILAAGAIAVVLAFFSAPAWAQSSLGIGVNEGGLASPGFLGWITTQQKAFYRSLTGAIKAMREDGSQVWILVGLSFAYGIFHAAGPGHGKVVISLYMAANEVALRRGVMLSFVSAFLQALSAIVLVSLLFLVLRGTSINQTNATWTLEIASYGLIAAFGAWLLWRKAAPRVAAVFAGAASRREPALPVSGCGHGHDHHHDHAHHAAGEVCSDCGHSHMPDPSLLGGDRFDWKTAGAAVASVGIRPCTGAITVLTFAFFNGLWLGGVLSVFAMALGTALTVATLATFAVTGKNVAMRAAGNTTMRERIHAAIEISGAAFIMLIGLLLLLASF